MAPLQWVRLDVTMPRNLKILALLKMRNGGHTAFVYTCSLSLAGELGKDGFISDMSLPFIHAKPTDVRRLIEVGLWKEVPGGWQINDWLDYQPSAEQAEARAGKARKAANKRWGTGG